MELVFSYLTYLLLSVLTAVLLFLIKDELKTKQVNACNNVVGLVEPPAPKSWPIIGHLYLMARYKMPYRVFDEIMAELGSVFRLDLGSVPCVVINGLHNIREVLMVKGDHFDSRPSFRRFNQLFNGNRNNCKYIRIHVYKINYERRLSACDRNIYFSFSRVNVQN